MLYLDFFSQLKLVGWGGSFEIINTSLYAGNMSKCNPSGTIIVPSQLHWTCCPAYSSIYVIWTAALCVPILLKFLPWRYWNSHPSFVFQLVFLFPIKHTCLLFTSQCTHSLTNVIGNVPFILSMWNGSIYFVLWRHSYLLLSTAATLTHACTFMKSCIMCSTNVFLY